jgi:hypothetical protein
MKTMECHLMLPDILTIEHKHTGTKTYICSAKVTFELTVKLKLS